MPSWDVVADDAAVAAYLARLPGPVREVAAELDGLVRAVLPDARAGIKWSVPFYARKGPVCYVSAAKRHVTFGFLQGEKLEDASGLLVPTPRSPIRKAVFAVGAKVPRRHVRAWLAQARRLDESWGET